MNLKQPKSQYATLSGMELVFKYIYENKLDFNDINIDNPFLKKFLKKDEDRYDIKTMLFVLKKMLDALAKDDYLPTNFLVPAEKDIYILKWPVFMPPRNVYHKDALEINYVLNGHVSHVINGIHCDLDKGDICFIAPNTNFSLAIYDADTVMFSIIIYTSTLKKLLVNIDSKKDILSEFFSKILYGRDYIPFLFCDTSQDYYIREQILDMLNIQDSDGPYTNRYLSLSIEMLCLRLLQMHSNHIIAGNNTIKKSVGITGIIDYAMSHYKNITLNNLAKKYNYSYSYLSALIKEHYGRSFNEILQDYKLDKAADMLKNTDKKISEIIENIGYSDKSYFYKVFKNKFNVTPNEYRKSNIHFL